MHYTEVMNKSQVSFLRQSVEESILFDYYKKNQTCRKITTKILTFLDVFISNYKKCHMEHEEQQHQDEGSYQLSHVWNKLLDIAASCYLLEDGFNTCPWQLEL